MLRTLRSLPLWLTSRHGGWISLLVALVAFTALLGALGRASLPAGNDVAPPDSESARAAVLAAGFDDADEVTVLLVATRDDGAQLGDADLDALSDLAADVRAETGREPHGPIVSDDGEAAAIQATLTLEDDDAAADAVRDLRGTVTQHPIDGVSVEVTGGPAFGVDVASAFDGADFTLLMVTLGIVALLLIVTYRSPVLWMVPLVVVALADQLANKATAAVGAGLGLQFDSGIVSVLVFGAGTNYALLLISRYREELARETDHRRALVGAWRATAPAIVASNVTVVLALSTLTLAVIPGTRGLGIASAVGLLIALAAVLLVLPPALAVCGRRLFWPFAPRVGDAAVTGRVWGAVAQRVSLHPWVPLVGALALLGVFAGGLAGASVGLTQVEKFRVASESAAGLTALGEHFPAGEAQPMIVIGDVADTDALTAAIGDVPGVLRVSTTGESTDGALVRLLVVGHPAPGTPESLDLVGAVREAAHAVPGDAVVGGPVAADLDAREGNQHDLLLIVPLVLAVSLLVLIVLLRSLVAPVLLLAVNILSAVAAIGAGTWLSRILFGWEALDLQVPLLSFLFLVALGIDYTIFLVHRTRVEARTVGTRQGMVRALTATGGVITSAGVVLAAVFAALGLLPLVTLGQIGLIVGIGVLVDTFVVRTLVVPAIFAIVGERMWWPGTAGRRRSRADRGGERPDGGEYEHAAVASTRDAS
ncbi:MMPL family transporter [Microbacterium oxydans]|uniref:MMPL family transporter n=1 Tax=Microbacterium oxydans TaxID=82380 RepID=UPI0011425F21|nr:MMPL family transporter [Microbacterium oxydans]KAB1892911.1 MMPL family transporter [Microbacterium oxydans]GED37322.1 membrane protein [Microbacterium oxydans]